MYFSASYYNYIYWHTAAKHTANKLMFQNYVTHFTFSLADCFIMVEPISYF